MGNYSNDELILDEKWKNENGYEGNKNVRMYTRYLVILKHLEGNSNGHILFQDESMIRDYQAIQKT